MTEMTVWVTPLCKEPEQWGFWLRTRNGQLKEAIDNNYNLMTNYRNAAYTRFAHFLHTCYMHVFICIH